MNDLRLSDNRNPKVTFPSDFYKNHYVGDIYGYYIKDTNFFNVMPNDVDYDKRKCEKIGAIYQDSNEIPQWSDVASDISWLSKNDLVGDTGNAINKIREALSQNNKDAEALNLDKEENGVLIGYWENEKLIFISTSEKKECEQEQYSLKLDVFSRNTGILESDIMMSKKALFIGCGSVGSLAALELAKAGVGHFMLIDNDIFGYHNICRHQCGIYDVGRFKTEALKDRILQINPYAEVVVRNMTIQEVPLTDLTDFCNPDTIVIGGADNRAGDLYANGIAKQVGMPFMSIGCWERAFAGEIFYCLPEGMPDYQDFMEVTGNMSGRVTQNRRFYTTEADLERVSFEPGISVDVNFVTIIAVNLALDLLNRDNEG